MPPRVILELTLVGGSRKVAAVDERTGIEVSFVVPAVAARADIERLARSKLAYVLTRKGGRASTSPPPD